MSRGQVLQSRGAQVRAGARSTDPIEWITIVNKIFTVERKDGRALLVQLVDQGGRKYGVVAVETDKKKMRTPAVLDDHGHKLICTSAPERAAIRAAERFARTWLKTGLSVEKCPCTMK